MQPGEEYVHSICLVLIGFPNISQNHFAPIFEYPVYGKLILNSQDFTNSN